MKRCCHPNRSCPVLCAFLIIVLCSYFLAKSPHIWPFCNTVVDEETGRAPIQANPTTTLRIDSIGMKRLATTPLPGRTTGRTTWKARSTTGVGISGTRSLLHHSIHGKSGSEAMGSLESISMCWDVPDVPGSDFQSASAMHRRARMLGTSNTSSAASGDLKRMEGDMKRNSTA